MHPFSGEFALADRVAGAFGGERAHMAVDAFGTPWTFFPYQDPISKLPFLPVIQYEERMQAQEEEKNRHWQERKKKGGTLTLHNRGARVTLGVGPDCFVVIFTQHIIVPVLTF